LEAEGFTIVDGSPHGEDSWVITNWRTGDVMTEGHGYGSHGAASDALHARTPIYHIDQVGTADDGEHVHPDNPEPLPGMPASLADALRTWVWERTEDARAWVTDGQPDGERTRLRSRSSRT
jgi:hypothetical protein